MIAALLLHLAVAASPCGSPVPKDGPRPFRTGETLSYDLDLLGMVKAGNLELTVERPISGGQLLAFRARAKTSAQVADIEKLTAVALSWVDVKTLRPERYIDEAEEGEVLRKSDVTLLPARPEVTIKGENAGKRSEVRFHREKDVLDTVSVIYLLRSAKLAPGDRFCFDGVGRGRYWRMEATVSNAKDKVETPAGRFSTLRVDLSARRADAPATPYQIHLWFSADARRLLVAAVADLDFGPASVTLVSVRGALEP